MVWKLGLGWIVRLTGKILITERAKMAFGMNALANKCCGGSPRKLIAGLWYLLIIMSFMYTLTTLFTFASKASAEGFSSLWSSLILVGISVGGTVTMRSFHSSLAIGLFVGAVVGASQLFFLLFLLYQGFANELRQELKPNGQEYFMSIFSLALSVSFIMFATILFFHRGDVLQEAKQTKESSVPTAPPQPTQF